ncbi:acyltransferase family protein [Coraliomargarita sp. SDUM461004]|uniref:Acyltransferase family protein n=1 Tax=Thalassobacterium sedimentorum TaxID=3041258 RepID=A0ABU1ALB5_9BACT|nr:acyltransferase family protein [Coraliomargarita sp. SDUM461004]MDQ8195594.1 acyltransferase family protein [Coraliomargarita sp. SDUM461004]
MRNQFVDGLKGVGILLVVVGHVLQAIYGSAADALNNTVYVAIYSFHMPLFALLSGYFAKKSFETHEYMELIFSRSFRLLIPFLVWAVILYFLHKMLIGEYYKVVLAPLAAIKAIIYPVHALWYLWVLLCLHVCAVLWSYSRWIFFAVAVFICLISAAGDIDHYFGLRYVQWLFPFFIIGYWFSIINYRFSLRTIVISFLSLGGLWAFLLPFYTADHFIYSTGLFYPDISILNELLYRFGIAILGCAFFCAFYRIVYLYCPRVGFVFGFLGRISLRIYALHFFALVFIPFIYTGSVTLVSVTIITVIVLLFSLYLSACIPQAMRRVLFGE